MAGFDDLIASGQVKVIELRGDAAKSITDLLRGASGREKEVNPADEKPWTVKDMVTAFGNYIDTGAMRFETDMRAMGMDPKDILRSMHLAVSHHVGRIEIHRTKNESSTPDVIPEAVSQAVLEDREKQLKLGWEHGKFHEENLDSSGCPKDPYGFGD